MTKVICCENSYCIYFDDRHCILERIDLNGQGSCNDCIYVNIEEKLLAEKRKALLERYQREDAPGM